MMLHLMMILVGTAILLVSWLITRHLRMRRRLPDMMQHPTGLPYRKLRLPRRFLRHLTLAAQGESPGALAARSNAEWLASAYRRRKQALRAGPPIPALPDTGPRLSALADRLAADCVTEPHALVEALNTWEQGSAVPSETLALLQAAAAAHFRVLDEVFVSILDHRAESQSGRRLAGRLRRSKQPMALLDKVKPSPASVAALHQALEQGGHVDLAEALHAWLAMQNTSMEDVLALLTERQEASARWIDQTRECLHALEQTDWQAYAPQADAAYALLQHDPSGVYPRMTAASQLHLRMQAEQFARKTHLDVSTVLQTAQALSEQAPADDLEKYVGYWFSEPEGLTALRRMLPTRRGRLYTALSLRGQRLRYAALWGVSIVTGFTFLQSRHPVWMLPFFALSVGEYARLFLSRRGTHRLPQLAHMPSNPPARTLVVLPAVLHDPHEAELLVRSLHAHRLRMGDVDADYLLFGDFPDSMTVATEADAAILSAAWAAMGELSASTLPGKLLYAQRQRTWNAQRHICSGRKGRQGAVDTICRLIADGTCTDSFTWSGFDPGELYRQYAFILTLSPDMRIGAADAAAFLRTISHPLCIPRTLPGGMRGYSVLLTAQGCPDAALIQPDAFLEATDGIIPPEDDLRAAAFELAGTARVASAQAECTHIPDRLQARCEQARAAWRCAMWQLPYVQTPQGILRNPLKHSSRFRLRELLRDSLVPLGRCVLLLYAVLLGRWLLLVPALPLAALSAPGNLRSRIKAFLRAVAFLPFSASVGLIGMWQGLGDLKAGFRRDRRPIAWDTAALWVQLIAATLLGALAIALPHMNLPALCLCVLFCAAPVMSKPPHSAQVSDGLSPAQTVMLHEVAGATWAYMAYIAAAEPGVLPPVDVTYDAESPLSAFTGPRAIAAYLLCCVCAQELGFLSADDASGRIRAVLTAYSELPMPRQLPCRRYRREDMSIADDAVDPDDCRILLLALRNCQKAVMAWQHVQAPGDDELSSSLERAAESLSVTLQNRLSNCEETECDPNEPDSMPGLRPLLHSLLLHDRQPVEACIRNMQQQGQHGLWGSTGKQDSPIYFPYAAALCLPHIPYEAAECLKRFRECGAFGPYGFCDALDCRDGCQPVGMQDTWHQGLILLSAAHVLTGGAVKQNLHTHPNAGEIPARMFTGDES